MIALKKLLDEQKLRLAFELSLWFKAIFAVAEIVAGAATYFVPQRLFLTLVLWVTKDEFAEDPHASIGARVARLHRVRPIDPARVRVSASVLKHTCWMNFILLFHSGVPTCLPS